jgi:predicted DCC family thiol-disulfide oxidoreductase YuxK
MSNDIPTAQAKPNGVRLALPADLPQRPELRPRPVQSIVPITLLYDRGCAVCRLEMDALRERDRFQKLRLIDISQDGFDAGPFNATLAELNALIHAIDAHGRTYRGVPALRMAYAAVGLGWLWAPTGWPLLHKLVDVLYASFARHRDVISRVAAPLIEHLAAARMARRMRRCANGVCER